MSLVNDSEALKCDEETQGAVLLKVFTSQEGWKPPVLSLCCTLETVFYGHFYFVK